MQKTIINHLFIIMLFCIAATNSQAGGFSGGDTVMRQEPPIAEIEPQGLIHAFTGINPNGIDLLKDAEVRAGGAIVSGITYNPASPTDRSNFPLTFNDRSNEFQLNRFRLFAQRDMNVSGADWDIGGRFDFVVGADARYARAAGLDNQFTPENRFNKVALPQLNMQVYAPYGPGITAQIGRFFTLIGSTSPFYSISYSAYSEPTSHTGILFTSPFTENLTLSVGAVLGTVNTLDNFDKNRLFRISRGSHNI